MSPALETFTGGWLILLAVLVLIVRRRSDVAGDNRMRRWLGVKEKGHPFFATRIDLVLKVGLIGAVGLLLLARGIVRLWL